MFTWQKKHQPDLARSATRRAVALVNETLVDPKNSNYGKELQTLRQLIVRMSKPPLAKDETQPETLINFFLAYGLAVRS